MLPSYGGPKYNKILTPLQLGFMEYYMLPEKDQFQFIYRPGDDSFLMMSVLKNEIPSFPRQLSLCEVGSGSGILSVHVNKWLRQNGNNLTLHIATDISIDACLFSLKYYQKYGVQVQQICTSLLKNLRFKPDIIICNPPYVPTDDWQKQTELKYLKQKLRAVNERRDLQRGKDKNLIAYTYMGGPEGLDTTRRLIKSITWQSKVYLIVMGEEGLTTLSQQIEGKQIIDKDLTGSVELLQFYKKNNEQLYVIAVNLKRN